MTTMTTQAGVPILPLPEKSTNESKQRTRTRSGSLLKVEQVGEASAERDLDQNLYVNINADWVNMKGGHIHPLSPPDLKLTPSFSRRLARSPCARLLREGRD